MKASVPAAALLAVCLSWVWSTAPSEARTQKGRTAADLSRIQEWGEAPEVPAGDTVPARSPSSVKPAPSERTLGESETLNKLFPTGPTPEDPDVLDKEISLRVHQLGTESHESQKAVERLAAIGKPALPALRDALRSDYKHTRVGALRVLGLLRDPGSTSAILDRLQDRAPEVRSEAVKTLGAMRSGPATATRIAALLSDPSVRVRREVPAALARIRSGSARAGLISALHDRSPEVRRQAAQELTAFNDAVTVQALLAATRDPDPKTVGFAVRSLGEIGDPAVRSRLQELTRSQDRFVREEAATALRSLP